MVARNITSDDLIAELDRLAVDRGCQAVLRCDNGPELACAAMADRAGERTGLGPLQRRRPERTARSASARPTPSR